MSLIDWIKVKWAEYQANAPIRHAKRIERIRQRNELLAEQAKGAKHRADIRRETNKHRPPQRDYFTGSTSLLGASTSQPKKKDKDQIKIFGDIK